METNDCIPEVLPVKMGIDFGSQNGFMAKHLLDRPQICTTINKMSCKGVSECMGTNIFFYSGASCQILDNREYHDPA